MADKLAANTEGNFYVTTACINCDQCRQLAPATFAEIQGYSAVTLQPAGGEQTQKANYALLACPTGAIVSENKEGLADAIGDFPLPVAEGIYYCGFTARHSYGASSYVIQHPDGNWLVDAPRWMPQLVRKFEEMGGIRYIFLSHRDDVADAAKYAERFGAERYIHVLEKHSQPDAEHLVEGNEPLRPFPDFKFVVTPGHTRGHMVLLYRNRFLFTGDHLAWDRELGELTGHEHVCWYSWEEQVQSMQRLAEETFEWILPGHGDRVHLPVAEMRAAMSRLLMRMRG